MSRLDDLSMQAAIALFAQQTDEIIVPLLTITHPLMADTDALRFALLKRGDVFASRGQEYLPFPFDLTVPSDSADRPPEGNISISNIDRRMTAFLESVISPPLVDIEIVLASTPDTVEIAWYGLEMQGPKYNLQNISATLQFLRMNNEGFPKGIFSPSHFPMLF